MKDISLLIIGFIGILEVTYYCFYNQAKQNVFGYEINSILYILFWLIVTIFSFYSYYFKKHEK